MSQSTPRRTSFSAILLLALLLLLAGGAAAAWVLATYPQAARLVGVTSAPPQPLSSSVPADLPAPQPPDVITPPEATEVGARIAQLEGRLAEIEGTSQRSAASASRADALLVAFAARRAIERGVPLGYLESLLKERFGSSHAAAVATILTASRRPVPLPHLAQGFAALEPRLKAAPPQASLWENVRRELGGLVAIRRADQPSQRPSPTYDRAAARLAAGQVDQALAEAMRLPGIAAAPQWVADARAYVAVHRALDEIETAALLAR